VVVEAAWRKAGMLHQFVQPDGVHSAFSEQLRCCGNNRATVFRSLFSGHAQSLLLESLPQSGVSTGY
jgi:hypothetical protein